MKRALLAAAAFAVAAVLAWNAWLALQLVNPGGGRGPSPEGSVAAGTPPRTSFEAPPSPTLMPAPTSAPPVTTEASPRDLERAAFERYFLVSETALHVSLAASMFGPAGDAAVLARLAGCEPETMKKILAKAKRIEIIETPAGGRYACVTFSGEAAGELAVLGLGADNMRRVLAIDGGRLWLGSGGEPAVRIRRNEYIKKGGGSYRDEIGDISPLPFFFRATRRRLDFSALPFFAGLGKDGSEVRISYSGHVSRASVKWPGGPDWVASLEVGPDMRKVGFADPQARFFLEVSTAGGKAAGDVADVLAEVLSGGAGDDFAEDFRRNTGMTPRQMAERFCGGRIFVWQPDGTEESEEAVFGFELKRGRTAEELVSAMGAGEAFGDTEPLIMVYRGRRIFFRDDDGEPGFSVGLIDGTVLISGSNESVRRAVEIRNSGGGDLSFLPPALTGEGGEAAPVLFRVVRGWKGVPDWLFGFGKKVPEAWVALAFRRRWLEVRSTLPPEFYLSALLGEAARNVP